MRGDGDYGGGLARALDGEADGFAVACIEEALELRQAGIAAPPGRRTPAGLDSGMHRLGLAPDEFRAAHARLSALPQVERLVLMSHPRRRTGPATCTGPSLTRLRGA
ncbi:alanine racemase [Pantoea ananatis]|uniref:alanine racemase n=1 Tax=Pantoea ananas TaxID=553 RepID=UPI00222047CE|nr:alanine racemase [Pantoea ananatis]